MHSEGEGDRRREQRRPGILDKNGGRRFRDLACATSAYSRVAVRGMAERVLGYSSPRRAADTADARRGDSSELRAAAREPLNRETTRSSLHSDGRFPRIAVRSFPGEIRRT